MRGVVLEYFMVRILTLYVVMRLAALVTLVIISLQRQMLNVLFWHLRPCQLKAAKVKSE